MQECNLCGQSDERQVYRDENLRVVMCRACSLVYLSPRPGEAEYENHYRRQYQASRHQIYDYDQAISRLGTKRSEEKKRKYLGEFASILDVRSRVLEVGAGWGTLLSLIRDRYGCEVSGIEPSELACEVAEKHYGLNVRNETFEEYAKKNPKEKFTLIVLHHVLEHFLDPARALVAIKGMLEPEGKLYLAVPNVALPDEPLERFFRMEHCYYFTPWTLQCLLGNAGMMLTHFVLRSNEFCATVARTEDHAFEVDTGALAKRYSAKRVLKSIDSQARKYRALRAAAGLLRTFLPESVARAARRLAVRTFKKTGIIKV